MNVTFNRRFESDAIGCGGLMARPQYRLRIGEVRVFCDVSGSTVEVLAIVPNLEAESWPARYANPK
jgi:hypothetical protein